MSARLPDINTLIGLGFTPSQVDKLCKYMQPIGNEYSKIENIRKILRKNDRQQFVNRFVWENLPDDLTGEFIERVLYYRYSGIFFYIPELNTFNFLPYVGRGLDEKGRYTSASPLPFNGTSVKQDGEVKLYIPGLNLVPLYNYEQTDAFAIPVFDENGSLTGSRMIQPQIEGCVILNSYCKDLSNRPIPEQEMIDPLLDMMAEAIPLARTNLFANSGITGMKVTSEDDYSNVLAANMSMEAAALNGQRLIPVVGSVDFQEFANKGGADGEPFFMYMQTLDNLRLQSYGLKNNGIFEKQQYINNTMAGNIQANVGQILEDALKLRQEFCDFVNATWQLGISVHASETVTNSDFNMDLETLDNTPMQQTMQQPQATEVEE